MNYFLRVEPPEKQDLLDLQSGVKELMEKLLDPKFQREVQEAVMPSMELQQLRTWFDTHKTRSLTEQAIAALAEYKLVNKQQTSTLTAMLDEPPQPTEVDAFSEDYDADSEDDSFLEAEEVKRQVMAVETLGGAPAFVAEERANDVVEDMKVATSYGVNDSPEEVSFEHLVDIISDIEEIISEEA